jgi:hypothetical protein
MKLILIILGVTILFSCKSTRNGDCDAYGKNEVKSEVNQM